MKITTDNVPTVVNGPGGPFTPDSRGVFDIPNTLANELLSTGQWTIVTPADASTPQQQVQAGTQGVRYLNDLHITALSLNATSATANWNGNDIGALVEGDGIWPDVTIVDVTDTTTIVLSKQAFQTRLVPQAVVTRNLQTVTDNLLAGGGTDLTFVEPLINNDGVVGVDTATATAGQALIVASPGDPAVWGLGVVPSAVVDSSLSPSGNVFADLTSALTYLTPVAGVKSLEATNSAGETIAAADYDLTDVALVAQDPGTPIWTFADTATATFGPVLRLYGLRLSTSGTASVATLGTNPNIYYLDESAALIGSGSAALIDVTDNNVNIHLGANAYITNSGYEAITGATTGGIDVWLDGPGAHLDADSVRGDAILTVHVGANNSTTTVPTQTNLTNPPVLVFQSDASVIGYTRGSNPTGTTGSALDLVGIDADALSPNGDGNADTTASPTTAAYYITNQDYSTGWQILLGDPTMRGAVTLAFEAGGDTLPPFDPSHIYPTYAGGNFQAEVNTPDPTAVSVIATCYPIPGGGWAVVYGIGATPPTYTAADVGAVPTARTVTAGTGLSGGGDLTANRTFTVTYGTTAGTAIQGNDASVTNARVPSGAAGGGLAGTYPNPTLAVPMGAVGSQSVAGGTIGGASDFDVTIGLSRTLANNTYTTIPFIQTISGGILDLVTLGCRVKTQSTTQVVVTVHNSAVGALADAITVVIIAAY